MTKEFDAKVADLSTCKDSFRKPEIVEVRQKGTRLEKREKQLYEQIRFAISFGILLQCGISGTVLWSQLSLFPCSVISDQQNKGNGNACAA